MGVDCRSGLNLFELPELSSLGTKAYKVLQEWKHITDLVPALANTQAVSPVLWPPTPTEIVDVDSLNPREVGSLPQNNFPPQQFKGQS